MFATLDRWLEDRIGYKQFFRDALFFRIPGGPRWRTVWGSALVFGFFTQLVTGVVLWMHYSPSTNTAWESVYYIQFEMTGGALLRGIHHYMAQAMIVLMALHLLQLVIYGAYKAPREFNYWTSLAMMILVLALGFTGYLLPWDQRGYRATGVGTSIAEVTPVVGEQARTLAVGGSEFGHHTLTRFFALHAGVLPALVILLAVLHVALFRKYGLTTNTDEPEGDARYWPDQALRDGIACVATFGVVVFLATYLSTHLGPPADPTQAFSSARPEWYFLFLFNLLKKVEVVAPGAAGLQLGAQVIPGIVVAIIALMPVIGRWKLGHRFNVLFVFAVLAGVVALTADALYHDYNGKTDESKDYLAAVQLANAEAERAHEIAHHGILPGGVLPMLQSDTKVAGYRLFKQHCASCHAHFDPTGKVADGLMHVVPEKSLAPNLFGVGSRDWAAKMLDHESFVSEAMFGYPDSPFVESDMAEWLEENIKESDEPEETKKLVEAATAALAASAELSYEAEINKQQQELIERGNEAIADSLSCTDCHNLEGDKFVPLVDDDYYYDAPDLTGYMSREWMIHFIRNPEALQFYGERNDRMPVYASHKDASLNMLTDKEIATIVDWLRRDWSLDGPPSKN